MDVCGGVVLLDRSRGPAVANAAVHSSASPPDTHLVIATRIIGGLVLGAALATLAGWLLPVEWLVRPTHGAPLTANAAMGLSLLAALLLIATVPRRIDVRSQTGLFRGIAVVVLVLGCVAAAQPVLRVDLGIDQLIAEDFVNPHAEHPGRTSLLGALSAAVMAIAFLLLDASGRTAQRTGRVLAITVFAIGYFGLVMYMFSAQSLYRQSSATALSWRGAAMLLLIAFGYLLARPDRGITRWFRSPGTVGVLLRRLLPAVLLLAPIVGWLQLQASRRPDDSMAVAVTVGNVIFLVALVLGTARSMQLMVAARERAEASVVASEERLHWAMEAASGGAWDWDLTNDDAWWSPEMFDLWQVAAGTRMTFQNSMACVDPQDRDSLESGLRKAIDEHSTFRCEFRIRSREGPERWMESRGRAYYDAAGRPVRLLGITMDVTARKRIELSLRQGNEALERSNLELQRFALAASHDLQTPLRTMASFAELLVARHAASLPEQGRDWLNHIATSAMQLQNLVKDLLQYARVDVNAMPFALVAMDETLRRAVTMLDISLREAGAQLKLAPLPVVHGDATQLAEVWMNLIGNALKYRSHRPPAIEVSVEREKDEWRFCVADNGIGIEPRHCERIFEMFERLHGKTQPGTGIGLAICRRVIERHGGRIWVESRAGEGSRFCFTLPVATSSPADVGGSVHA